MAAPIIYRVTKRPTCAMEDGATQMTTVNQVAVIAVITEQAITCAIKYQTTTTLNASLRAETQHAASQLITGTTRVTYAMEMLALPILNAQLAAV